MADPANKDEPSAKEQAERLLERGLALYSKGALAQALTAWERGLELDSGNQRIQQYIEYVRDNFTGLDRAFREARRVADEAKRAGVPLGEIDPGGGAAGEDEYDAIEVTRAGPNASAALATEVDSGWDLDAVAAPAPLPPPPEELQLERNEKTATFVAPAPASTEEGFALSDLTPPPGISSTRMHIDLELQTLDEEQTMSRAFGRVDSIDPIDSIDIPPPVDVPVPTDSPSAEFQDVSTSEHTKFRLHDNPELERREDLGTGKRTTLRKYSEGGVDDEASYGGTTRAWDDRLTSTGERSSLVEVDPALTDDIDLLPGAPAAAAVGARLPEMHEEDAATGLRPIPKPPTEVARGTADDADPSARRVLALINRAQTCSEDGDHNGAVDAAEAALSSDPEDRAAQQVLHRHKELLLKVFEDHLGDPTLVPCLAVAVYEIPPAELDHRTAFLLSRVDGALTVDEVLDVAGMPRFETYRMLSRLVRRGILNFS